MDSAAMRAFRVPIRSEQSETLFQRGGRLAALLTASVAAIAALLFIVSPAQAAPGDLDPTFGDGDGKAVPVEFGDANAIALQANGKMVVAGTTGIFTVIRCHSDGSLDHAFGDEGKVTTDFGGGTSRAEAIAVQPDGKIVAVGNEGDGFDLDSYDFAVARYNPDGSPDTGFGGGDGMVSIDFGGQNLASDVALQPDGEIIVVGGSGVARLNPDGTLDTGFGGDGKVPTFGGSGVALQPDGKIVVGSTDGDLAVVRYLADGSLDPTFAGDGIATADFGGFDVALDVAVQSDGKVMAAGHTEGSQFVLARFDASGNPDSEFGGDGKVVTDFNDFDDARANALALQFNGKIVVVGQAFWDFDPGYDFVVTRYNPDGSLDAGFGGGDGIVTTDFTFQDWGDDLVLQSDGKIVAAGWGDSGFFLARYEGDVPPDADPEPEPDPEPDPDPDPESDPQPESDAEPDSDPKADTPPSAIPSPRAGTAIPAAAVVRGNRALLRILCRGGGPCRGQAKLMVRLRLGKGRRARVRNALIGRARFGVPAGGVRIARVNLTRFGRRLLRRVERRSLRVWVVGRGIKNRAVGLRRMGGRARRRSSRRSAQQATTASGRRVIRDPKGDANAKRDVTGIVVNNGPRKLRIKLRFRGRLPFYQPGGIRTVIKLDLGRPARSAKSYDFLIDLRFGKTRGPNHLKLKPRRGPEVRNCVGFSARGLLEDGILALVVPQRCLGRRAGRVRLSGHTYRPHGKRSEADYFSAWSRWVPKTSRTRSPAAANQGAGIKEGKPLAAARASAASLGDRCVRAGTRPPKVLSALMSHPGDRKTQTIVVEAKYRPMPSPCHGVYRRVEQARFQIQSPHKRKRWITVSPFSALVRDIDEIPEEEFRDGPRGIRTVDVRIQENGGIGEAVFQSFPNEILNWQRYRCTPGRGVTRVRALFRNTVVHVASRRVIGRRTFKVPVGVKRYKYIHPKLRKRGAVQGPC